MNTHRYEAGYRANLEEPNTASLFTSHCFLLKTLLVTGKASLLWKYRSYCNTTKKSNFTTFHYYFINLHVNVCLHNSKCLYINVFVSQYAAFLSSHSAWGTVWRNWAKRDFNWTGTVWGAKGPPHWEKSDVQTERKTALYSQLHDIQHKTCRLDTRIQHWGV